ncbi:MAG: N-acetyltransferase family protein [Syntrophobacteria bacterium]
MILYEYPKTIVLEDETRVTVRPLRKEDEKALHEYFSRLPLKDRLRLKDDVTDPKVIERWIYDLDYDVVLPLVALDDGRIIANATLHFNQIGWTKHQAEIRITSDQEYRQKGLATHVIQELIEIAAYFGLEQLTAEIAPTLDTARTLFEKLGFWEAAVLKGFIKDMEGNQADLVLMMLYVR